MASEKPDDPMNNTAGTDEETIAQRRKRLRRVSFADREITSVHIFNRDEDYETPPNSSASKLKNGEQADTSESEDKVIRFFGEIADSEDTEGDGDAEDGVVAEKSFLRPKGSPSSGGSTIGSATSDDEDNFFGPVSSHFINPGRLSDDTISEEHHDITMDSTAFSMHFRSLAVSESGDLKTPTSRHIPVEEKTPSQVTSRSDTGSEMALTEPKKLFSQLSQPFDKGSGGGDSNDMSIVGENSRKYDYGYISPTLADLLGDESKELLHASAENSVKARSPIHDFSLSPQIRCIPIGHAYKDSRGMNSNDASQMLSPYGFGYHSQILLQESGSQRYTKEASFSSSTSRRQSSILPQPLACFTPSPKQGGSFMSRGTLALVESFSTIQKSKSRLGSIPPLPISALSQRIENSKLQLSKCRPMTTPSSIGREEICVHREQHVDIPITNLEDLLSKHDNRTPLPGKKGTPDKRSCSSLSPEGNTKSDIEGLFLSQQQRNHIASTPEQFLCSLANSDTTTLALDNFVILHDHEQQNVATGNTEPEDENVTKDCASNVTMDILSGKVDSLLAESGVLPRETGFLNSSAQQNEKENFVASQFFLKDENHLKVYRETEVFSAEDRPDTSISASTDAKGVSRLKRKAKDVDVAIRNCSPKVGKCTQYISNPVEDQPDGNYDASNCCVGIVRKQVMNWREILRKASIEISQMLAPLANKLNSRLICKLEDILTHLKKVHMCEILCLQIQSEKVCDDLTAANAKRRAESRSLLCKLAYEKAKLDLLHLKQEIMMKKYQAMSTGVQTFEILRLNCAKLLCQHDFPSTGMLITEKAYEVTTSNGAELTEEINILDSKIQKLIKYFPTFDKITGESSYADTITITEEKLKKKMSCRSIRQDILVWVVESLGERNDCHSIVLKYNGLINQRLKLKPGHASWVLVSNSLSDKFIRHFPGMNVSVAFNSLFNVEYSQKYVGRLLSEITQKTSLLLHNLLDVSEEFQLARMEIPNLVQGSFDSPKEEQLHLRVSFIACKNLRKVTMILDVTCLTLGKYPGDIVPCELVEESGINRDEMNEIKSAIVEVGVGYPRILRLCRCISKVLRSQIRCLI